MTAQSVSAGSSISGTLTNTQGGPISNATVQLNGATQQTVTSDVNGKYTFPGVAPGVYSVDAVLDGCWFSPSVVNNLAPGAVENFSGTCSGLWASISLSNVSSQSYTATVTLRNNSQEPANTWEVAINLNQSTINAANVSSAEALAIGGQEVFNPGTHGQVLNPGASQTFSFVGTVTGSNYAPTVATVDGVTNGTWGAGMPADGIDLVARGASSAAIAVALAYENNKPANKGDPNYSLYDALIWDAHTYAISNGTIVFDPNAPGYAYVSQQAMAALALAQLSPPVAAYLVSGLQSCFNDTNGTWTYDVKAGVFKGFTYPGPSSGSIGGGAPPAGAPPGYNAAKVTDSFTVTGAPVNGSEQYSITLTGAKTVPDYWFGLMTYGTLSSFPNTSAVLAKFKTTGVTTAPCSPFNGPGGAVANPYLVITLNGQTMGARPTNSNGAQCQNGCTATMTVDPVPYAEPGAYYNSSGNLVGTQGNPFQLNPTVLYATPDHASQWATRVVSGVQQWGTFTTPVTLFGVTEYKYVQQM